VLSIMRRGPGIGQLLPLVRAIAARRDDRSGRRHVRAALRWPWPIFASGARRPLRRTAALRRVWTAGRPAAAAAPSRWKRRPIALGARPRWSPDL